MGYDDDGDAQNPLTVVAEYRYDATGRRIEYIDHTRSLTTRYYYDGQNVILETDESDDTQRAYVNGPQYIDERGVMRCYEAGEIQDHYYLLAELYTVAGLADCRGWLEEVAVYDTYGDADIRAWPPGDISNRDGTTGWEDSGLIWSMQDAGEFDPLCDADFDGDVDMDDVYAVVAIVNNPAINQAVETTYSALDNPYFFTGRTTDTLHADDLLIENDGDFKRVQDNRNRMYDPKHGRWLQRDPLTRNPRAGAGFQDGINVYEYVKTKPTLGLDPSGLEYWDYDDSGTCELCIKRPLVASLGGERCRTTIPCCIKYLRKGWTAKERKEYIANATCGEAEECCDKNDKPCWSQKDYNRIMAGAQGYSNVHGKYWPMCCTLVKKICEHDWRGGLTSTLRKRCILDEAKCRGGCKNNPCHAGNWIDRYCHMVKDAQGSICKPTHLKTYGEHPMWTFQWCEAYPPATNAHLGFLQCSGQNSCMGACEQYCSDETYTPPDKKEKCLQQCEGACKPAPSYSACGGP